MKIKVDWFKKTGKWYAQDIIEVTERSVTDGDQLTIDIVNLQSVLSPGWIGEYSVVTDNMDDNDLFCKRLYGPSKFNVRMLLTGN